MGAGAVRGNVVAARAALAVARAQAPSARVDARSPGLAPAGHDVLLPGLGGSGAAAPAALRVGDLVGLLAGGGLARAGWLRRRVRRHAGL